MRNSRWPLALRGWSVGLSAGMILLAAGFLSRQWPPVDEGLTSPLQPVAIKPPPADEAPVARAVKPPPTPADGFVGSDVCAKCHTAIAETYRSHPMFRSAGRVPGENEVEDFKSPPFSAPGSRRYRVERTETEVVHHEFMVDASGAVIADLAVPVHMFIGSGTRGKTYMVNRGGLLFESLISWFSTDGGRWDLSPGYEPLNKRNFERRIRDACIMCHAGRVANTPGEDDTFENPVLLEAPIGCERCHGPGAKHVARQEAGVVASGPSDSGGALRDDSIGGGLRDDSIVNPERLDPARRESVCNQCHLQGEQFIPRYGRTFYDFRPGQLLDEVWTVSVEGSEVREDGTTRAVSQVQQMHSSACYRQSAGRMSCNSCHPAHSVPDSRTKADYYRRRCQECHAERGCVLPQAERAAPPAENSCIHCHMPRLAARDIPHTSQTDHRVVRSPKVDSPKIPNPAVNFDLELFDHAEERLPRWEVDRVRGINLVQRAQRESLKATLYLREAELLLRSSLRAAPDDVRALAALGQALTGQERTGQARECFERLLEIEPRNEKALEALAEFCHGAGDFKKGIQYGQRLLTVNPWIVRNHARQADMLRGVGRLDEALDIAEQALGLDPWHTQIRSWLVEAYRIAGDGAASRRHAEFLRRMRGG